MSQTLDRFRSSTWGWLRGTLAGWGTILLVPIGAVGTLVTERHFPSASSPSPQLSRR